MADKQAERDRTVGPFHSFRVTHVIRPGGGAAGSSEITTGYLSPAAARDWISEVAKTHRISQREPIHPAHGVPAEVAELLGLEDTDAARAAAVAWEQDQIPEAPGGPAGGGEGASPGDD